MKTISKKQFENAVEVVLNGGKSKMIQTKEVKPFTWVRSGGRMRLNGVEPANSKYLRNDARGGKESDVYLVCSLADGFSIAKTKSELKKEELIAKRTKQIQEQNQQEAKNKKANKAIEKKKLASSYGFKSVAEMKRRQSEIIEFNNGRFETLKKLRENKFIQIYGKPCDHIKISDRVKLSKIEVEFNLNLKKLLF